MFPFEEDFSISRLKTNFTFGTSYFAGLVLVYKTSYSTQDIYSWVDIQ